MPLVAAARTSLLPIQTEAKVGCSPTACCELGADAAQDHVDDLVAGAGDHHVADPEAGHRQVVVGARQGEVERRAGGRRARRDHRPGHQALELEQRRDARVARERLLEAGAAGLAGDQRRVGELLDVDVEAAARERRGQAVADRDVAGEVGAAGVLGIGGAGRRQEQRGGERRGAEDAGLLVRGLHRGCLLARSRGSCRAGRPCSGRCRRRSTPPRPRSSRTARPRRSRGTSRRRRS